MMYIAAGMAFGGFLGWFSHRYQKMFLSGLMMLGGGGFLIYYKTAAKVAALMASLPPSVEDGIYAIIPAMILARIATWAYYQFVFEEVVETRAEYRARVLAEYGMADPLA